MRRSIALLVVTLALAAACKKDEPKSTRWDDAAAALATAPVNTAERVHGDDLNKFFPADGVDGMKRVFVDESKKGTSIAKLTKDGKDVAILALNDANGDDAALKKFDAATEKLGGYPVVKVGGNQSAVLVNKRYQVKVSSQTLDHEARKAWLQRFDLAGLAKL